MVGPKLFSCVVLFVLLELNQVESNDPEPVCPKDTAIASTCDLKKDHCTSNNDCKGQQCCPFGCGKKCVDFSYAPYVPAAPGKLTSPAATKQNSPNLCPKPTFQAGLCVITEDSCKTDKECGAGKACCPAGCGNSCIIILRAEDAAPPKGTCPKPYGAGLCVITKENCKTDADCPKKDQQCCTSGCGKKCFYKNQLG